ncbi:hypothetical protein Bhyg_14541, partial [Pseudolycoriella hygida]
IFVNQNEPKIKILKLIVSDKICETRKQRKCYRISRFIHEEINRLLYKVQAKIHLDVTCCRYSILHIRLK